MAPGTEEMRPDPQRWAVEAYGIEKRFKSRQGLPGNVSVGDGHWLASSVMKYRRQARWVEALRGVDLQVARGEIFGLLGPNGAGKTTLIKCLTTLLSPDAGQAWVNGYDVRAQPDDVRLSMNLVGSGHWVGFDAALTVTQNLHFFGSLYGLARPERRARIEETLRRLGMARHADSTPMTLSAGERQRMLLAKGFLVRTPVFFLDEPTVGLDPEGAREVREWVRSQLVGSEGTSAILTTHRMGEAEELCARIAIMDRGRIVACGTPLELKRLVGDRSVLEVRAPAVPQAAVEEVRRLPEVRTAAAAPAGEDGMEESLRVLCEDPDRAAGRVVDTLRRHGVVPASVDTLEPTLEDAFIALTDRRLEG